MFEKLKYFSSLMGVLTGISVFFPYANNLTEIVCIDPEYNKLGTTLAPLTCVFLILLLFTSGKSPHDLGLSLMCFGIGMFYISLSYIVPKDACVGLYSVFSYVSTFAFFTMAFAILAVMNYQSR